MHYKLRVLAEKSVAEITRTFDGIPVGVTSLDLSENDLGYKSGAELAQIFAAIPATVTSIELRNNWLDNKNGAELAEAFRGIPSTATSLDLRNNNLDRKSGAELAEAFRGIPRTITSLDLGNNNLDRKSGAELAEAFRGIPRTITSLNLENNNLYRKSGAELAQAFAGIPAGVTSLNLGYNRFCDMTSEKLAIVFAGIPATVTSIGLQYTNLYANKSLAHVVAGVPATVTSLDLSNNSNSAELAQIFASIPATVNSLNLSNNNLGILVWRSLLAKAIEKIPVTVTSLNLSGNHLDSIILMELADAFKKIPAGVTSLDITNNNLNSLRDDFWVFLLNAIPQTVVHIACEEKGKRILERIRRPNAFNPFIHGTSSQTLSMIQSTDFQLMPIIAMLQNYKVAPMFEELEGGGFNFIENIISGAPVFQKMQQDLSYLDKLREEYAKYSDHTTLESCTENFKTILERSHKSAFTELNLLMIYLVRLRQLRVTAADVTSLNEISTLKERLNATIQFYYFILCIQKYIFIDTAEIERFKKENNLGEDNAIDDYIKELFSFENFLKKFEKNGFSIEEIYNSPSLEHINRLIEFVKIPKDSQTQVDRYPSATEHFQAKRDYYFFTARKHELQGEAHYEEMHELLFANSIGLTLSDYLKKYFQAYDRIQKKVDSVVALFPDFEKFHTKILPYIEALKDRVKLCHTLLDADESEFVLYDKEDELITKSFPVVLVTKAKSLEVDWSIYRSRVPLKLGKDIVLVATDTKDHQKRLRDYLQKNNVGPVEVLLFDDLQTLSSQPDNFFDAFANDDLIQAFELAKKQNRVAQFSKIYRVFSELNEKRFHFKSTNQKMYAKLSLLFTELQHHILTPGKDKINFGGIKEALQRNKQENYALYATHRGILGIVDRLLTILASLVVFYPITYLVQKSRHYVHTFFATDTETKIDDAVDAVYEEIVFQK